MRRGSDNRKIHLDAFLYCSFKDMLNFIDVDSLESLLFAASIAFSKSSLVQFTLVVVLVQDKQEEKKTRNKIPLYLHLGYWARAVSDRYYLLQMTGIT